MTIQNSNQTHELYKSNIRINSWSSVLKNVAHLNALVEEAYLIKAEIDRNALSKNQKKFLLHDDREQTTADLYDLIDRL